MARKPKLEHVKAKALTRGDVKEVGIRYMFRLHKIVHHMHEVLQFHKCDDVSVSTGISQYVISLACHLETFFRDIFRFSLEQDAKYLEKIVQIYKLRLPDDHDLALEGITRYDFVAESLTLQSAQSISDALDPLFPPSGFIAAIENSKMAYDVPSRRARGEGFPLSAFPNWWKDLSNIFELRHELSHDANSTCSIERSQIAKLESLAVFLPQYVTLLLFNSQTKVLNDGIAHPVILLVEDFLAKDWVIVDG